MQAFYIEGEKLEIGDEVLYFKNNNYYKSKILAIDTDDYGNEVVIKIYNNWIGKENILPTKLKHLKLLKTIDNLEENNKIKIGNNKYKIISKGYDLWKCTTRFFARDCNTGKLRLINADEIDEIIYD
jgi:hypothetical protein